MLIDYVVPYGLCRNDGRANNLLCKLRYLATIRSADAFRLFAPYRDYDPDLPKNVTLLSQRHIAHRVLQEILLNIVYIAHLMKRRPDCLITRPDALFVGHFLAKLVKVRLILNIHSYPKEEYEHVYNTMIGRVYAGIVHAIFAASIRCADGIIFNHPQLQQYVTREHAYQNPAEFIYNGADTATFYPMDAGDAKRLLSMPMDKTILLFLGTITKWHGVEYLLDIASVLQEKSPDFLLYIVGGHPATEQYLRDLAESAPPNVIFTGQVDSAAANLYVNAADICLLPVNNIRVSPGSPIKLFNYIAAGKPVVTQEATTGYSDIVLSYELGYVLDFRDSRSAADRIIVVSSECQRKNYRRHNREVALTRLSWRAAADRWSTFLDKVANV